MRISDWSSDVCSSDLAWALRVSPGAKLILTKGAPLELMKARQRRFYFDQDGKLIAHFGLRELPARVRQNGRVLEVSEVALPSHHGPRPRNSLLASLRAVLRASG